ncbi:hypothetical protein C7M84_018235 [Penaeus vannamei]|uniref:Reverse transcriptase/retrotransposon-derived protein RNase H-like domain-containing protein n=1 Tax=Penaeus vannamei TaxID=6689 RepID=A0A3R7QD85_PENVA|nr:hypothetical protein C7M84_018235 [Penaeus vannamei]
MLAANIGDDWDLEKNTLTPGPRMLFRDSPGLTTLAVHDVNVGDAAPVKQAPYRVNPNRLAPLQQELNYMLEHGLIEACQSDKPFKLAVDASDVGAGAVLLQEDDQAIDHPDPLPRGTLGHGFPGVLTGAGQVQPHHDRPTGGVPLAPPGSRSAGRMEGPVSGEAVGCGAAGGEAGCRAGLGARGPQGASAALGLAEGPACSAPVPESGVGFGVWLPGPSEGRLPWPPRPQALARGVWAEARADNYKGNHLRGLRRLRAGGQTRPSGLSGPARGPAGVRGHPAGWASPPGQAAWALLPPAPSRAGAEAEAGVAPAAARKPLPLRLPSSKAGQALGVLAAGAVGGLPSVAPGAEPCPRSSPASPAPVPEAGQALGGPGCRGRRRAAFRGPGAEPCPRSCGLRARADNYRGGTTFGGCGLAAGGQARRRGRSGALRGRCGASCCGQALGGPGCRGRRRGCLPWPRGRALPAVVWAEGPRDNYRGNTFGGCGLAGKLAVGAGSPCLSGSRPRKRGRLWGVLAAGAVGGAAPAGRARAGPGRGRVWLRACADNDKGTASAAGGMGRLPPRARCCCAAASGPVPAVQAAHSPIGGLASFSPFPFRSPAPSRGRGRQADGWTACQSAPSASSSWAGAGSGLPPFGPLRPRGRRCRGRATAMPDRLPEGGVLPWRRPRVGPWGASWWLEGLHRQLLWGATFGCGAAVHGQTPRSSSPSGRAGAPCWCGLAPRGRLGLSCHPAPSRGRRAEAAGAACPPPPRDEAPDSPAPRPRGKRGRLWGSWLRGRRSQGLPSVAPGAEPCPRVV